MNLRNLLLLSVAHSSNAFSSSGVTSTSASIKHYGAKTRIRSCTSLRLGISHIGALSSSNKRAIPKVSPLFQSEKSNNEETTKSPVEKKAPSQSQSQESQANIPEIVSKIFNNLSSGTPGDFGTRGEYYFIAQVALVLCIFYGNIPLLGDVLTFILGPCLVFIGAIVAALGVRDLGSNLSPWPKAPENAELVTNGIYGEVRHPIYAGLLYLCLGISIWTGSAMRVLLSVSLGFLLDQKSKVEEKMLCEKFKGYGAYQSDVGGKFFPNRLVDAMPWKEKE